MKKKILKFSVFLFATSIAIFFLYCNNISLANPTTQHFFNELKKQLKEKGYSTNIVVISTKRFKWHNNIQSNFSGAAKESRHLIGDAIDFIIFDINKDGVSNYKDVDEVYKILDEKIILNKGGIGTYKNEKGFINRQMVHIDCRGYKARWHK
ncbi:MAG: DUF882 domain-containing protein [Ferruginibacter sp.]|nr:DUF882 domain-containing protein [Ferruginibacter sp.]